MAAKAQKEDVKFEDKQKALDAALVWQGCGNEAGGQ